MTEHDETTEPEVEQTTDGVGPTGLTPSPSNLDSLGGAPQGPTEDFPLGPTGPNGDEDPETFPRAYVQQLRDESAKHRQRAADRDALAERLHASLVAATGRLADPTDLPYDDAHLDDADALTDALDELLARKPHLASRRVVGDVGQGASTADTTVDLAGMLRRNAG